MICPALHQDIARFQVHLRIVEEHVDLAGQDNGVVDRSGAVHARIAWVFSGGPFGREAEALDDSQSGFVVGDNFLLRGEFDYSKDSAAWGRSDSDFAGGGVFFS